MSALILDSDPARRAALASLLSDAFPLLPLSEARHVAQARPEGPSPLIVLWSLEDADAIARLVDDAAAPSVAVIALGTDASRAAVMGAIRAGACGFIQRGDETADLLPALHVVLDGRIWLPPSINERRGPDRPGYGTWVPAPRDGAELGLSSDQTRLLRYTVQGWSTARIATALGSTEAATAAQQSALQGRFDASSRLQLVLNLARSGLRLGLGH